jgi:hypothetical protein
METLEVANVHEIQTNRENSFALLHAFPPPEVEKLWRDCLSRVEFPAHYDSPEFFLEPFWIGKRPFAVLALNRGVIVGVLTGINEGTRVVSGLPPRPQVCVDATADKDSAMGSLARGLLAEAGSAKLVSVYSWSSTPLDSFDSHGFRRRELEGNVVLDLTEGAEFLFKQFHENRRRNIRYAIRQGVEVSHATSPEETLAFYQIYCNWRQTSRKKITGDMVPAEVFEERFRQGTNFRLLLAYHGGRVIAGITLRFHPGGLLEFSNNSSLDEYLHLRPNDLLQWRAIEWACREGFRRYSFGGAHPFLKRFGGTIVPICRYQLDRTLLHQHDIGEAAADIAKTCFHKSPALVQRAVRELFDKDR